MIWNHYALTDEPKECRTLCGVTLAERNGPRFNSRDVKTVNCKRCRANLLLCAQPKEKEVTYEVQIDGERAPGREIIKFLEPERNRILSDLERQKERMREMMDGRDLRPNYADIIQTAQWIVRLQKAADILGGYKVDLDAGRFPKERQGN